MMSTQKQAKVLGALLHDIGKFMQRAKLEKHAYPEIKSYYDEFCPTPTSYLHAAHSAFFVEELLSDDLFDRPTKECLFDACRHHCDPQREDIYQVSDRLSAGMERAGETQRPVSYRDTRLRSVFDSLELEFQIGAVEERWHYPISELNVSKGIFPIHSLGGEATVRNISSEDSSEAYRRLWTSFEDELDHVNTLPVNDMGIFFNELYYLLHRYTWSIPSATNVKPADISLFDHSKTTAAICACLAACEGQEVADNKEFLLLGGDCSGIQSFIFHIVGGAGVGGVSKRLRGRSFYLMMLMEVLCRYLISKIAVTVANINFCGGGNMELLLPNTRETCEILREFEERVNQWLFENLSGHLALIVDWVPMSRNELRESFAGMKTMLQDRLSCKKMQKHKAALGLPHFWVRQSQRPDTPLTICRSCNLNTVGKSESVCRDCDDHKTSGALLPRTKALVFASPDTEWHDSRVLKKLSFGPFGNVYMADGLDGSIWNLKKSYLEPLSLDPETKGISGFYLICNILPTAMAEMVLETESDPDGENDRERLGYLALGQTLSFTTLADMATGDTRIGVLKMDVDNLGLIFTLGLEPGAGVEGSQSRFRSISRISTVSRQLSLFFNGIVAAACREVFSSWSEASDWGKRVRKDNSDVSNIFYTVFSGGDDLFVIGPWDRIIELAVLIRSLFKDFTCHNPNLTISAGIFVCKPKYPIALAAAKAEDALEQSKRKGKNRITVLGETATWDYEDRLKSKAFATTLRQVYAPFEAAEIGSEKIYRGDLDRSERVRTLTFSKLLAFADALLQLTADGKIPRGFVHRLIEANRRFFHRSYSEDKNREQEQQNLMILPHLEYLIERNLPDEGKERIRAELITGGEAASLLRQMKIPASICLMKTRAQ